MATLLTVVGGNGTSTPEVTFTLTIIGEGGTAEIYSKNLGLQGPGTYPVAKDSKVTVTLRPDDGYDTELIFLDDDPVMKQKSGFYHIKVTSDTEMTVRFKTTAATKKSSPSSVHKFNLSIIGGEGSVEAVSKTWGAVPFGTGEHSVPKVTLLLTPKNGWATSLVNANGSPMTLRADNSYEITVTGEMIIGVRFTEVKKTVAISHKNHGMRKIFENGGFWPALALILATAGGLWYSAGPGKEISNQVDKQKMQDRCLEAVQEGIILSGCDIKKVTPSSSSPKGASGVHSSCPGIQVGRFTVYDGTSRKGCTVTVTGENQARIKGNFTVTTLKDHPYGVFVNVECETYEHRGTQATFVKQSDRNGHPCTVLALPSDASSTTTVTATSL